MLSGFFEPVFYLFAVGVGIGELVGDVTGPDGNPISYAAFVAPALLGASAMNGAIFESTMNVFFKLKYGKVYDAILATPMSPGDVAVGEIGYSLGRGGIYATGFLVVMWAAGYMPSPWGWLALPAALLIGFAFAAVGMAATTFMRSWQDLDMVTLATLPLFLFSATFYPLSIYPEWLQWVARVSPLYHGVEILRGLTLGSFDWSLLGHVLFLVTMGATGLLVAGRRISLLLLR
jgi:lipooligosaccharide transport system permease protein